MAPLADLVLLVHFGIVLFVVLGLPAVFVGGPRGWRWTRARAFRVPHLAAIAFVVLQAWLGQACPLTRLESWLRARSGATGYDEGFIEHWVGRLLFYDAPTWVFTLAYTAFGLLVLTAWWRHPPRRASALDDEAGPVDNSALVPPERPQRRPGRGDMTQSTTDLLLQNNEKYARGEALHRPTHPGPQPIQPARRVAVVACMDARIDVEDLLGLQTGDAHIIRNAGGVVTDDAIRCLIISHHLLNTNEIILIHHTRCGMLAFTDDLLKLGLEGDAAATELLGKATGRQFVSRHTCSATPSAFHAFRGPIEPLDAPRDAKNIERLAWDVRRGISAIRNHPWIPVSGPDAVTVRGFIYDVDTGRLEEVTYPGPMGSLG